MPNNRSFGPGEDDRLWNCLLDSDKGNLRHDLWYSVIRTIAAKALELQGTPPVDLKDAEAGIDELVDEWMSDTLPLSADLIWAIGESDYFRDIQISVWYEQFSFVEDACGCVSDVLWDLNELRISLQNGEPYFCTEYARKQKN
jgi:hypothetical protein